MTAEVYRTGVYAAHGQNPTCNTRDGIFADSLGQEMITLSGSSASGYSGTFTIGVSI